MRRCAMKETEITVYFVFTDTGTYLSKAIKYFTNAKLNHVSIGLNHSLTDVYSFGRKVPRNPFSGGFVKEDIDGMLLKNAKCAIYAYTLSETEFNRLNEHIKEFENEQGNYKYNFLGLFCVLFNIEINRKNAYFCSQFVATVMEDTESFRLSKSPCFVTPLDILEHPGMSLIYQGTLGDYLKDDNELERQSTSNCKHKQSTFFIIKKHMKHLVFR